MLRALSALRSLRFKGPALLVLLVTGSSFLLLAAASAMLPEPLDNAQQRELAKKEQKAGNYKDALEIFQKLVADPNNGGELLANDLNGAFKCLQSLQRSGEIDVLFANAIDAHPDDWRLYWQAADLLGGSPHMGQMVAGQYNRGARRGGGRVVSSSERDHFQRLAWMETARQKITNETSAADQAQFLMRYSYAMIEQRQGDRAWLLQALTDFEELPDYQEGYVWSWGSGGQGAPVDSEGNPIFYSIPDSFESAKSDGERWRWLLEEAKRVNPVRAGEADMSFANFLMGQFSVQSLRNMGIQLPAAKENEDGETAPGVWALSGLSDDETIARLATGPRRLTLPDEFNYIKLFRKLADLGKSSYNVSALEQLSYIYKNRQQYGKAADVLRELIRRFPSNSHHKGSLKQIVDPWGRFEPVMKQPAGQGATVDYVFRNGSSVHFTAYSIRVDELLQDVQKYLQSNPKQIDWQKTQLGNIGYRMVTQNENKYRGAQVATWNLDVKPRLNHFDRRVTVTTPLQKAGAYLLVAKMANGNTSRIVLWLDDTAIIKKPLNQQQLHFVCDATTGKPIPNAQLDFFGWKQVRIEGTKRDYRVVTTRFAEKTDAHGFVTTTNRLQPNDHRWLTVARTPDGRMAFIGFDNAWYPSYQEHKSQVSYRAYLVTDRPVYRPSQKVEFKVWLRQSRYDEENAERGKYAGKKVNLKINDPMGTEVFAKTLVADEYGGVAASYELPEDAKLGAYTLYLHNSPLGGLIRFSVEEYKKPEFEVLVDAPSKPVQLGEKVTAKITAKYYYGAPVAEGTLKLKVERNARATRWYPPTPWDWLYGEGYWWFCGTYDWYPGFIRWGCFAPRPYWFNWSPDPPELVLQQEVPLQADGTYEFEIDTSLAKELHGNQDHEYSITAEVVDASRRTIVGTGSVTVARDPFKVFLWTERGHFRVGDVIPVRVQARTPSGNGVEGKGTLNLLKIVYDEEGKPEEQLAQSWELNTDDAGAAAIQIKGSEAGQYRLSYELTAVVEIGGNQPDKKEVTIEGGYVFVIRGEGFDGSEYRFNDLELVADKSTYQVGDKVRLMINTNRMNSTVLLFLRPNSGAYASKPKVIQVQGKSTLIEIPVEQTDMPNFFVEALAVSGAKVHTQVQQIVVPPEKRVIDVEILPNKEEYLPGQKANVQVKLTDDKGEPIAGSVVLTAYDRAVEYISGGSNVEEIRAFFWSWKRSHQPYSRHSLQGWFSDLVRNNEARMSSLGIFGDMVADMDESGVEQDTKKMLRKKSKSSRFSLSRNEVRLSQLSSTRDEVAGEAEMLAPAAAGFGSGGGLEDANGSANLQEPVVRKELADTAFWKADIETNEQGIASVSFDMPENLSDWKLRAWGLGQGTRVGEGTVSVVTSKNLVVRLQAPRFFIEKDEVVLSAVVHNYLQNSKTAEVRLGLGGETLELLECLSHENATPEGTVRVEVPADGEVRVDWRCKASAEGEAKVTMSALTDEESDAMQQSFPVYVHGFLKTESFSGVVRAVEQNSILNFNVPADRRPEQSRFELRYSPSLAGAMVDALPYLVDYPYGCTEQTLNRFVPTVITQNILQRMNLDLGDIRRKRTNLNAQEIGEDSERAEQWKEFNRNPVFDEDKVAQMAKQGIKDLTAMQLTDGGWGWFSGWGERSYPHTTAVVVHGLQTAIENDLAIPADVLNRGVQWLQKYQKEQVALLMEAERREDMTPAQRRAAKKKYKSSADNIDALVFMTLVDAKIVDKDMQRYLFRDRLGMSLYSQALVGLAFHELGENANRDTIIRNIDQFIRVDNENQTAYLDLPNGNYWWNWYGNQIEANAFYLKLLTRTDVKNPKAAGLVKFLLNNRKHATYWSSTRDTAYCIEALAEYWMASGETEPNTAIEVWVDGKLQKTVNITAENLFSFDNAFVMTGEELTTGPHRLEIRKKSIDPSKPSGPIYFNGYLTNFTTEDFITKAGLEIKVERKYYRLNQVEDANSKVQGSSGQVVDQEVLKYKREELVNLSEVTSGDLIEIELKIDSKNDYEYVIFEDFKAAGCEPVDLRSGYTRGGLGAYVQYRDEKVAFFMRRLARGTHSVSYQVRAEVPGKFSALPTHAYAMYAPELKANSDELKLKVQDRE